MNLRCILKRLLAPVVVVVDVIRVPLSDTKLNVRALR